MYTKNGKTFWGGSKIANGNRGSDERTDGQLLRTPSAKPEFSNSLPYLSEIKENC